MPTELATLKVGQQITIPRYSVNERALSWHGLHITKMSETTLTVLRMHSPGHYT